MNGADISRFLFKSTVTMDTEEIEFILSCPICMDEYDDPRILPCQHSFCEACLSSYIKDRSDNNRAEVKTFPCPVCRRKTKLKSEVDDASTFERDLTKLALLQSKHILLQQVDDSSAESIACEAQTMTIDADSNAASINDSQVKPIADKTIHQDTSIKRNRDSSTKRSIGCLLANDVKNEANRYQTTKNKNRRQKKLSKRRNLKTEPVGQKNVKEENKRDLDFPINLVVSFVIVPLYKPYLNNWPKCLAIFLAVTLCLIYTTCTYITPYLSVFFLCTQLLSGWRNGREELSLYCLGNGKNVRKFDVILFLLLQCSALCVMIVTMLYAFVFTVACKNTLSNALWKNDSVVSWQEFEGHFVTSASDLFFRMRILNINAYYLIKQVINVILF